MQLGLRLNAAGGAAALAYVAQETAFGVSRRLQLGYPLLASATVTAVRVALSIGLMVSLA